MAAERKRWAAENLLRAEVRRISRLGVGEDDVIDYCRVSGLSVLCGRWGDLGAAAR